MRNGNGKFGPLAFFRIDIDLAVDPLDGFLYDVQTEARSSRPVGGTEEHFEYAAEILFVYTDTVVFNLELPDTFTSFKGHSYIVRGFPFVAVFHAVADQVVQYDL